MQRLPVEVAERIITNLSDKNLFIGSSVCRVWWQIVRQEAYKREEERKGEIEWQKASYAVEELNNCMGTFAGNQVYIMNKMLKYEMIVDLQEREIIEYASSEFNWGGDPWRFDWEWNEWTQQE
ncbi:hypothetical protein RhiirA4_485697 [Rhizophagus irregularis]|uniref:F-box domain-containing protein n=1 Tax=Rhizophagus irregularis TaxID=588596 RepID=A0A2I1HQI2_9GLOM|nr:hypothetical protein RhiirA4_485697 [Rhizophagus irregularis]